MPTKAQIAKAEQLLNEVKAAKTLLGRDGSHHGEIQRYGSEPAAVFSDGRVVSLETLERWVKQIKSAQRKQLI